MKKPIILLAALLSFTGALAKTAKIESYPYPASVSISDKYKVEVNGVPVTVLKTAEPDIATFGTNGRVTLRITCLNGAPDSVIVRPIPKGYEYSLEGNVITLELTSGDRVSVEPDYSEQKPLFIFVNPLEKKLVKAARRSKNLLFFAEGRVHDAGQISLSPGETVYIQGGAIVNGFIKQTTDKNLSDVTISGCGILDARDYDRENAVRIHHCDGLHISNITTLNRNCWTTLLYDCSNSVIDNYHVVATRTTSNKNGNENDGIDIVGCRHLTLKHCFSYAHDDAYVIKTGAFKLNGEAFDIHHEDLVAWNITSGNSFEIGYSCDQDVYDIWYKDLYAIHSGGRKDRFRRAGISLHQGHGSSIHDIHYENVYIEDPVEHIINFMTFKTPYPLNGRIWKPGKISNVTVRNLKAFKHAPCGSVICGFDEEHPIENISFTEFFIGDKKITSPEEGDFRNFKNIRNISFE